MIRQAIILAGGKGTRLRERLNGRPKPLVEVGGIPLLEHQVLLAKRHGINRILVLVNHAAEQIVDFCASRGNWGIEVGCVDDGEPAGTAGAVLRVFDELDDAFLVLYGDTMLGVDLARFCKFHSALPDAAATLFLHPNDHPHDSDLVEIDEEARIAAFHPYPHDPAQIYPNLVNAGLYAVHHSGLARWRSNAPLDFGKDLFPAMLRDGARLYGYNSPEYIKDCGTPERLDRVSADLASGRIAGRSLALPQAAVFIDRDGTINTDVGFVVRPEQLELIPGTADAIARLNGSAYRSVVITNQPVIARGDCTVDGLRRIHGTLENMLSGRGAYIDRLYYCPHHPDRGFPGEVAELKVVCTCRKPNTGLVDRATAELNVARDRSWMIGDSTTDVLLARRAGLKSILVETGKAGLDGRAAALPDFVVPDLAAAVDFILDEYPGLAALADEIGASVPAGGLVFIGGLSRGGKTTLSNALRIALERLGRRSIVLGADRWLLDAADRGSGVLKRYEIDEITRIAAMLIEKQHDVELSLPIYDRLTRRRSDRVEEVVIRCDDVVIIEGTVVLRVASQLRWQRNLFYVETDEELRRERVLREYRVRGCEPSEAEAIYAGRQQDESPEVMGTATIAQRRIFLPLSGAKPAGNYAAAAGGVAQ